MIIERTFEVGDRVRIEAATTAGDIIATRGLEGQVEVVVDGRTDGYTVEQVGDLIIVKPEKGSRRRLGTADITLTVPPGTRMALSCTSGDIAVEVPVDEAEIGTASGDVRLRSVERTATVRTASGDIRIDSVGEQLSITTASGDVRVGAVGRDVSVTSASGDVTIDVIGERAEMRSASGDIDVRRFDGGDLVVRTLAGDLRVGIPARRRLDFDLQTLSGELRNRLEKRDSDDGEPERTVQLRLKTVSGDVTLRNAD